MAEAKTDVFDELETTSQNEGKKSYVRIGMAYEENTDKAKALRKVMDVIEPKLKDAGYNTSGPTKFAVALLKYVRDN